MRATFDAKRSVWIVREPNSGFSSSGPRASWHAVLRNLGLARDPVQALAGQGQPPAVGFVFTSFHEPAEHQES